ncbi:MAG: hypothetical protein N2558_05140, partial [Patescibacteria group bacterium]|nr:hypothetical protein [Patescibacteria group bacterium]
MKKNYFLFTLLLMFVFVGTTLSQNTEGAARMEIIDENLIDVKKDLSEIVVTCKKDKLETPLHKLKPIKHNENKIRDISVSNIPNKITKVYRIKKNLSLTQNNELSKLLVLSLVLSIISII